MLNPELIHPCQNLPHSGSMCLLDAVVSIDEQSITCSTHSHKGENNPLRSDGQLASINAIEYAAQAMAIHAGCTYHEQGRKNMLGFLASARDIQCFRQRLDDIAGELSINATRLAVINDGFSYQFQVLAEQQLVVSGRLSIRVVSEDTKP